MKAIVVVVAVAVIAVILVIIMIVMMKIMGNFRKTKIMIKFKRISKKKVALMELILLKKIITIQIKKIIFAINLILIIKIKKFIIFL